MAEQVNCPDDQCTDPNGSTGDTAGGASTSTAVTKYCPFRDVLTVDGDGVVSIDPSGTPVSDGDYNTLTVVGGCVTALSAKADRGYVAPACCPEEGQADPTTDLPISGQSGNLTSSVGGEVFTSAYFSPTSAYTVTGNGTSSSPWAINGPTTSANVVTGACTGNQAVELSGSGTTASPLKACHADGALAAGTYDGVQIDAQGHIVAINIPGVSGVKTYVSDHFTIEETGNANECSIEPPVVATPSTVSIAGVRVSINEFGDITGLDGNPDAITATIDYTKGDGTVGNMTFTDGVLTGVT